MVATAGSASAQVADVQAGHTYGTHIVVGGSGPGSEDHPGAQGEPAIGVATFHGGRKVAFAGLQAMAQTPGTGTAADPKLTHITPAMMPSSHGGLGYFNFAQAGAEAVFFGEWSDTGSSSSPVHTVYYAGKAGDVASTLPAGRVTYTVKSINNAYAGTGADLPTSTLTAHFGHRTAYSRGDIVFSGGQIGVNGERVQLLANNVRVGSVAGRGGQLNGDFFGTGAAAVAGTIKFIDRSKDTAFGGVKN